MENHRPSLGPNVENVAVTTRLNPDRVLLSTTDPQAPVIPVSKSLLSNHPQPHKVFRPAASTLSAFHHTMDSYQSCLSRVGRCSKCYPSCVCNYSLSYPKTSEEANFSSVSSKPAGNSLKSNSDVNTFDESRSVDSVNFSNDAINSAVTTSSALDHLHDSWLGKALSDFSEGGYKRTYENDGLNLDPCNSHKIQSRYLKTNSRRSKKRRMGGSTTSTSDTSLTGQELEEWKERMESAKLTDLASNDPRKARRIYLNRIYAAQAKERKVKRTEDLERASEMLQALNQNYANDIIILQNYNTQLHMENAALKLKLQMMEQHALLSDEINEALRYDLHLLSMTAEKTYGPGHAPPHECS